MLSFIVMIAASMADPLMWLLAFIGAKLSKCREHLILVMLVLVIIAELINTLSNSYRLDMVLIIARMLAYGLMALTCYGLINMRRRMKQKALDSKAGEQ